jgi:hypothetical protein
MDAGPNITIASPRSCAAPIVAPALDLLLRHVASDLMNASDRRNLSMHPHRASSPARAGAQHRIERDFQHDAVGAADSRA